MDAYNIMYHLIRKENSNLFFIFFLLVLFTFLSYVTILSTKKVIRNGILTIFFFMDSNDPWFILHQVIYGNTFYITYSHIQKNIW